MCVCVAFVSIYIYIYIYIYRYVQSWSELSAPLVTIEGCENESALLILLIFYKKNHKNLTFHWIIRIEKVGGNIIMK